jgi:uncharacterized membrane protein
MKQIKNLGIIGSILFFGAIVPKIGPFLGLAGLILVIIAIYQISKLSDQKTIFRDYLVSIILPGVAWALLAIIKELSVVTGSIILVLSVPALILGLKGNILGVIIWVVDLIKGLSITSLLFFALVWVAFIISGFFLKKSFTKIAEVSGVSTFRTTGNLYFIGSILLLLFGLGGILIFTSLILQVIAFASFPQVFPKQTQASG